MPSESVAGFLDRAQASRVLFPEQIEQLIRQPDIPQSDLSALCEYLLSRGVLTRFQAGAIREARGGELNFAGYPIIDVIGPCPGGTAYKALHPSLRTPLVLRRIRADWLSPADNPINYIGRARTFGMIDHPNLIHLLDAGTFGNELYVVTDQPAEVADVESLAKEIGGAMPGTMAAEYGRAVASALRFAHERGGAHGDIRPTNLLIGPLAMKSQPDGTTRRRPAQGAIIRLAELGLVPIRPPASAFPEVLNPYLPPERLDVAYLDPRGDIYGLGAAMYFLLAVRAPFSADDPDLATKIRSVEPTPLATLRPDLPAEFVALIDRMMAKQPERRPATAYEVEAGLMRFCRPGVVPQQPAHVPLASPASSIDMAQAIPSASAVEPPLANDADVWGIGSPAFDMTHTDSTPSTPRRKGLTAEEKSRGRKLMILGGLLHMTAITLLVLWLTGVFESSPAPLTPEEPKPQKRDSNKKPIPKNKNLKADEP